MQVTSSDRPKRPLSWSSLITHDPRKSVCRKLIAAVACVTFLGACSQLPAKISSSSIKGVADSSPDTSRNAATEEEAELLTRVQTLLTENCSSCHNADNAEGEFSYVDDLDRLVADGKYVVPGDPEASILYRRMAPEGDMPPAARLDPEESALIAQWIEYLASKNPYEKEALAFLQENCAACHSEANPLGGFSYVLDVEQMINNGTYLVPGRPDLSTIYTLLAPEGTMPPARDVSPEDKELMSKWITALGEDVIEPLTDAALLTMIRQDLENNVNRGDRRTTRYFTLQNAHNRRFNEARLETLRQAMNKTINSLSFSRNLVLPTQVDENGLVFRVNLTQVAIDANRFEAVISDYYPFSTRFEAVNGNNESVILADNDRFIRQATESEHYLLRIDWFVSTATLPVAYERLLNLAESVPELERQVGVDTLQNIENNTAVRSGFRESNVSSQNRIIERHVSNSTGQAYWVSYDFISNSGQQSIFNAPLGPRGTGFDDIEFEHDGGEYIFHLPNGLFAYYLSNEIGTRIDRGPQSVVRNDNGPRQLLGNIVNGFSCMSCHNAGILRKDDQVRDFANNTNIFSQAERNKIFNLFIDSAQFNQLIDSDNQIYHASLRQLGINPFERDPIELSFGYYHQDLSREGALIELQINDQQMNFLLSLAPFNSRWIPLSQSGGRITREEFNELYNQAVILVNSTKQPVLPNAGDYSPSASCLGESQQLFLDECVRPL